MPHEASCMPRPAEAPQSAPSAPAAAAAVPQADATAAAARAVASEILMALLGGAAGAAPAAGAAAAGAGRDAAPPAQLVGHGEAQGVAPQPLAADQVRAGRQEEEAGGGGGKACAPHDVVVLTAQAPAPLPAGAAVPSPSPASPDCLREAAAVLRDTERLLLEVPGTPCAPLPPAPVASSPAWASYNTVPHTPLMQTPVSGALPPRAAPTPTSRATPHGSAAAPESLLLRGRGAAATPRSSARSLTPSVVALEWLGTPRPPPAGGGATPAPSTVLSWATSSAASTAPAGGRCGRRVPVAPRPAEPWDEAATDGQWATALFASPEEAGPSPAPTPEEAPAGGGLIGTAAPPLVLLLDPEGECLEPLEEGEPRQASRSPAAATAAPGAAELQLHATEVRLTADAAPPASASSSSTSSVAREAQVLARLLKALPGGHAAVLTEALQRRGSPTPPRPRLPAHDVARVSSPPPRAGAPAAPAARRRHRARASPRTT
eukprot:TRINITY_DN3601_c0_g1_i3.p2 TRINITY_DN3601_c0_g1~~TRINITY_DN3601_c0_g1_i3.p2  ORF type:complete len:491 (+),score=124.00 TRINITY_DN3601_c0_g1_i3:541-2013(+)